MQITYSAPNRAHHYAYARVMAVAGCLRAFVCGFSRFSPRAALPEIGGKLIRADHLQNFYLAALRLRLPVLITDEMAYWSKRWIDRLSEEPARQSNVFLFYSGAGLATAKAVRDRGVTRIVEAVNSHVLVQQALMADEYLRIGLSFTPFHPRETERRVQEYEEADYVLCPSTFVRDSFISMGTPESRVLVVPYGFNLPTHGAVAAREPDVFRVLYVGQISVRKGLRYLIKAFARLDHPRKELVIVGPITSETGLDGCSIPENVQFAGVLKGEDLATAYRRASVFVLPAIEEGLALVLGEAMSHGLPIIATTNSGGSDLFSDGVEGFIVPIRDSAAIADKLQQLAGDDALRSCMSKAAFQCARSHGGWETNGRKLMAQLRSVVGKPCGSHSASND